MGALARRRQLLDQMPHVPCDGRCSTVACRDLAVSELDIVAARLAGVELGAADDGRTCSALDDGRCTIHADRPFICRVFGATRELACPYGCEPERWLDAMSLVRMLIAVEDVDPRSARYQYIGEHEPLEAARRRAISMLDRYMSGTGEHPCDR